MTALRVMAGPDGADRFRATARWRDAGVSAPSQAWHPAQRPIDLLRRQGSEAAYAEALKRWTELGATLVEFDLEPFYETARLLYEGPWVAERYLVIRNLLASSPDSIHPVTREITAAGARLTAADTFAALYRLQALRRIAERTFTQLDAIVLPTAPTTYTPRRCWPTPSNSTAGSAPIPISSICSTSAAWRCPRRCGRWHSFRHHAAGPGGQGPRARQHRPGVSCRHPIDCGLQGLDSAAAGAATPRREQRRIGDCGGRRAPVGHGAQWRIEGSRRPPA